MKEMNGLFLTLIKAVWVKESLKIFNIIQKTLSLSEHNLKKELKKKNWSNIDISDRARRAP